MAIQLAWEHSLGTEIFCRVARGIDWLCNVIQERHRKHQNDDLKVTVRKFADLNGHQVRSRLPLSNVIDTNNSSFIDNQYLASGGNDNRLYVWNQHSLNPVQSYSEHMAAVKAIAWSPHHHGLLVSGGGTADRCIRFWNTLTGQPMQCVDTGMQQRLESLISLELFVHIFVHLLGSQVCNLAWSKHSSELVSTHGYSQNQILVWKYPSLTQVAKLTGHSYRVLYLALSPDGEAIVTGAGDETLRFWNVFSKARSQKENKSVLNLFTNIR